jgi:hypothetical protein
MNGKSCGLISGDALVPINLSAPESSLLASHSLARKKLRANFDVIERGAVDSGMRMLYFVLRFLVLPCLFVCQPVPVRAQMDEAVRPTSSTRVIYVEFGGQTTGSQVIVTADLESVLKNALPSLPKINAAVVRTLLGYRRDGTHMYWWPKRGESAYDGCTTDILIGATPAMRGEAKGRTFCCGLTLEVFYKASLESGGDFANETSESLSRFKDAWFCRKINSPGPLDALSETDRGTTVTDWDQALPGDFVQIWRNNRSGHSVVFVAWALDTNGKRVGIHYWSTQMGTRGIGFNTELFGESGKSISKALTSIARAT